MKAFLLAAVAAIGLATVAATILDDRFQTSSADAFTTSGVRLEEPGDNLIE